MSALDHGPLVTAAAGPTHALGGGRFETVAGDPTPTLDRRHFVAIAASTLVTIAAGGCATVAAVPMRVDAGRLRIPLLNHPGLSGPGGFLKVLPEGRELPVYVLGDGDGRWAALSPVCTHQGCLVDVQGAALVCPCHGSTYDRQGQVLRGPAERPLTSYLVREDPPGTLVVELQGAPDERAP